MAGSATGRPTREGSFLLRAVWVIGCCVLLGYLAITGITMMHEKEFGKDQTPESAYHPPTSNHAVGAITTVIQDTGWFSCGSSPAALDEMIKWATLKDQQEVIRTLIKTGSTRVTPGTR